MDRQPIKDREELMKEVEWLHRAIYAVDRKQTYTRIVEYLITNLKP